MATGVGSVTTTTEAPTTTTKPPPETTPPTKPTTPPATTAKPTPETKPPATDPPVTKPPVTEPPPTEPPTTEAPPPAGDNLYRTLAGDARFSTFTQILRTAGYGTDLAEPGPLTVFAPTNEAFDGMDQDQL